MKTILKYLPIVPNLTRENIQQIKAEDPERFKKIVDTECPEFYGLPSFRDKCHLAVKNVCKECWEEALKYE